MALTLATGSQQTTAAAAVTPFYLPSNYVISKDVAGEVVYSNVSAPLDQPNNVRFASSIVQDIFKNTGITPSAGQRTDGVSIMTQVQETWKVDDAADSMAAYFAPATCHMVMKVPKDALVTAGVLEAFMLRMIGCMFRDSNDTYPNGLNNLVRGICKWTNL